MSWYDAFKDARNWAKNRIRSRKILREEIERLKQQQDLSNNLIRDRGVYWIKTGETTYDASEEPICPNCFEDIGKIMHMKPIVPGAKKYRFQCTKCKNFYDMD